jgi:hypothetical protein
MICMICELHELYELYELYDLNGLLLSGQVQTNNQLGNEVWDCHR